MLGVGSTLRKESLQVFVLIEKLQKCNPRIYLKNKSNFEGMTYAGIFIKKTRKRIDIKGTLHVGVQRLRDSRAGHRDMLLSNTPWPEVTEIEQLNLKGQALGMKGWRSIVLDCVAKGAFSLDKAKEVFTSSLGEWDWDKLDFNGKQDKLLAERNQRNGY